MLSSAARLTWKESDTAWLHSKPDKSIVGNKLVFLFLKELEDKYLPSPNNFISQKDLQPYMRKMVANWMVEVCEARNCHEDVLVTAINYLDRTLAVRCISRSQLQLLGAVCMFIASKFKDTEPISAQNLVMYTDYSCTTSQLLDMELIVLTSLKWELSVAGPYDFLDQLLFHLSGLTDEERATLRRHAAIFIVMCSVEPEFSVSPPSLVSSACLCAAAGGFMGAKWCKRNRIQSKFCRLTSIDKECLNHCQEQIEERLRIKMAAENDEQARSAMDDTNSTPQKSHQSTARVPNTPTDVRDIVL